MSMIYKRIIVKFSGEALADKKGILDQKKLATVAHIVRKIHDAGVEVGIVVGAGNIWRGRLAESIGIEQAVGDYMGMLGTIINALAIQSAIEQQGLVCKVQSSINVNQVCEPYIRRRAIHHLEKGEIVIFAGGTGNPYFTTDTTATLRALEVGAEAILMAKNGVDGVYDSDPRVNPEAKLLPELTFHEVIEKKLKVMDLTAVAMLEGKDMKIHVFNMDAEASFMALLEGKKVGTIVR
ncbi:MAG: UMP kinase [Bacilli bacterium]|nr:UMP kinase [Bacilli bacterium]